LNYLHEYHLYHDRDHGRDQPDRLYNGGILSGLMMNPYSIEIKINLPFFNLGLIHINHVHLMVNMFSFIFSDSRGICPLQRLWCRQVSFILPLIPDGHCRIGPSTYFRKGNPAYNSLGASVAWRL